MAAIVSLGVPALGAETAAVRKHIVALDIGHTVLRPGAKSARGEGEFLFNQRIVRRLAARLDQSRVVQPVVINSRGDEISLTERTKIAASAGAELFLSIHHDAAHDKYLRVWDPNADGHRQSYADKFKGYGVFVSNKNVKPKETLAFAQILGEQMRQKGFSFSPHHSEPIRGENRPIIDKERGIYRYDDLIVLKTAKMPAVLLECGVIINRQEELELKKPETQARIVDAAADAIEAFFQRP